MEPINIPLPDLAATQKLAKTLAPYLAKGDVVCLQGELGAGKTEFARALLKALGVEGDVPSPTFTLVQNYEIQSLWISHFDLYRLKSAGELDELGWDDALAEGLTLIEWPERAQGRLPPNRLTLDFALDANGTRSCTTSGTEKWQKRLSTLLPAFKIKTGD